MTHLAKFDNDYSNKRITVTTELKAPVSVIWNAFTNPTILEKWFAPKPFRVLTKTINFTEGGKWLYYMLSPEGEKFWSVSEFRKVRMYQSFEATDAFCDENGKINTNLPQMVWTYNFSEENGATTITAVIKLTSEQDMNRLLEMGFEEGYEIALEQLQKLLKKQVALI